ncbi:MAG: DegT/DnrJ/EryC1/StrS family aminotransferase [Myxococcota bacterium]|nr:DegT/DnrJ/EryC1/StrS family aminotransferase [Myxococcota bacterium]
MFRIPLMRPTVAPDTGERIAKVLESGMLTEGSVTREFESSVAAWLGVDRALSVTSCTTGLEAALRALGIGPGDEVLVPDYTYPATASVVRLVGAEVVLVDVEHDTMRVSAAALEAAITPRTRAALPVSLFGSPLDADVYGVMSDRGITVIEDAACSLGAKLCDAPVGTLADLSVFSLHPRKLLTTGEGGLITARDPALLDWIDSYKHFGMEPGQAPPRFVRIGNNLKLSNLLAAVGLAQLPHLERLIAGRREAAARYDALLEPVPGASALRFAEGALPTHQTYCVRVAKRDRILSELRAEGIEVQIGSYALHRQPAFANDAGVRTAGDLPGSTEADDTALALPLYADIAESDQQEVVDALARRLGQG